MKVIGCRFEWKKLKLSDPNNTNKFPLNRIKLISFPTKYCIKNEENFYNRSWKHLCITPN